MHGFATFEFDMKCLCKWKHLRHGVMHGVLKQTLFGKANKRTKPWRPLIVGSGTASRSHHMWLSRVKYRGRVVFR